MAGLGLVGGLLVGLLKDGFGRAVDEVLASFRPRARERAHLLDDLIFLRRASRMTSNSSFSAPASTGAAGPAGPGNRDRRGGGDVEGGLELLHETR